MELDGSRRGAYRLVVGLGEHEVIFDAQPLSDYQGAVAHVAAAVRRHARDGRVVGVALQRRVPAAPIPDNADPGLRALSAPRGTGEWTTLEHWGSEVTERIMTQYGGQAPTGSAERSAHHRPRRSIPRPRVADTVPPSSATSQALPRSGCPARTPQVGGSSACVDRASETRDPVRRNAAHQPTRAATHRWHLVVTVAVVAIAWLGVAFVMAGGRLDRLLGGIESTRPAVATELPFHAPKPVPASRSSAPSTGDDLGTQEMDRVASPLLTASPSRPL